MELSVNLGKEFGFLELTQNPLLEKISVGVLHKIDFVRLKENPGILDLNWMGELKTIGNTLHLENLDGLKNLSGLENLSRVENNLLTPTVYRIYSRPFVPVLYRWRLSPGIGAA